MNKVNRAKELEKNAQMTVGATDVVINGVVHQEIPVYAVMVPSQADLANLPSDYMPGTIAYLAGFTKLWQKAADGTWIEV